MAKKKVSCKSKIYFLESDLKTSKRTLNKHICQQMKFPSVTEGNVIIFPAIIPQMQIQHVSV